MSEYIGNIVIALFCSYLFITNLVAVCFIATDNNIQTNSNAGVIETSYIGLGSTIVLAFAGTCYYWYLVSRGSRGYYTVPTPVEAANLERYNKLQGRFFGKKG